MAIAHAATGIMGEKAIANSFTAESANYLAIQLPSGALPVPLKSSPTRNIN
jgi:preprotein translocase subunit SecD